MILYTGAMYSKEPQKVKFNWSRLLTYLDRPKSANLMNPSWSTNIFSGFMSL